MRFSLSATTALLLQVSTTAAEAASSSSATTFLDAFQFGRSPPIQRKRKDHHRGLVIQTDRRTKSSKVDHPAASSNLDGSSPSLDAKASKKDNGYRLMPKSTKQAKAFSTDTLGSIFMEPPRAAKSTKQAKAFFTDTLGSIFMEPPRTAKSTKQAKAFFTDMSYSFVDWEWSMPTLEFSMPGASTPPPTSFPSEASGGGNNSGGDTGGASPSPTPRDHQPSNFHEVIFKYLSVCTGVELEMDCLTSTTIDALMTMQGGEATRARARRFLGTEITEAPTPTFVRATRSPTVSEVTPSPSQAPLTPFPTYTVATPLPTSTPSMDQCRPEVTEADLLSILTTSQQTCIDSGSHISHETFQSTLSSFLAIFDKSNTCWNSFCGDSDPTSDLFFQILFDQAAECANVALTVDDCILDHILEVVFSSGAAGESGARVRRSLQDSCCEPTESDLSFYASYLLLSADAACAEKGSVEITTEEWNKATEDLVQLFGATECWGVEPCEEGGDVVVGQEVPTPSPTDKNDAISVSSEDVLPYHDGPILSEDGQVCTLTTDNYAPEAVRSLELIFYYQVETTSDSLDLGLIERALIALVCDDAGNERRLNELETEVVAVDASPEDVISEEYSCAPSTPGSTCQVIKGALTILLVGPITPNEETLLLAKISSLFPIALDNTDVSSITYLVTPTPVTSTSTSTDDTEASSYHLSPFGITAAATAVLAAAALARGAATRRVADPTHPEEDASKEYKGQDELTIAATAELTCASDEASPKHHVVSEEEREHWRELGMEGAVDV